MPHKTWNELYKFDITNYVKKRDGADYLPWAECMKLLHTEGGYTKVMFTTLANPTDGSSVWRSEKVFTDKNGKSNSAYEVRIQVTLGDETGEQTYDYNYPIISGMTPVRDDLMTQTRVASASARAFVKCVAIVTGLGFGLWVATDDEAEPEKDLSKVNIFDIKTRMQESYTAALKKLGMSTKAVAEKLGYPEDLIKTIFTFPDQIHTFETELNKLL